MFRFETLEIWHLAVQYCQHLFAVVDDLPQKVQYSLGSQLRSAVLSISNNIAEGSGSDSKAEFKNFLNYSIRSTFEVVSMLIIAKNNRYLDDKKFQELYTQGELLVKKISAFRKAI